MCAHHAALTARWVGSAQRTTCALCVPPPNQPATRKPQRTSHRQLPSQAHDTPPRAAYTPNVSSHSAAGCQMRASHAAAAHIGRPPCCARTIAVNTHPPRAHTHSTRCKPHSLLPAQGVAGKARGESPPPPTWCRQWRPRRWLSSCSSWGWLLESARSVPGARPRCCTPTKRRRTSMWSRCIKMHSRVRAGGTGAAALGHRHREGAHA